MNTLKEIAATLCRWTARIVGSLLILLVAILTMDDGIPIPAIRPLRWDDFTALGLILMLIGILAGWRWELAGGILSLVGFCLGVVRLHNSPDGLTGFYFALGLPGLLYVASALIRRNGKKAKSATGLPDIPRTAERNLKYHET